jgi:acyl carrier protein
MRWRRILVIVISLLVFLPIAGVGIFIATFDPNGFKPRIENAVMRATGRELSKLGVTSLDLVEIIMTIEDKYDVAIPGDAVEAWNSYKTVSNLIELGRSLGLEGHRSGA